MKFFLTLLLGLLISACNSDNAKQYSKCAVLIPHDYWESSGCRIENGKVLDPVPNNFQNGNS